MYRSAQQTLESTPVTSGYGTTCCRRRPQRPTAGASRRCSHVDTLNQPMIDTMRKAGHLDGVRPWHIWHYRARRGGTRQLLTPTATIQRLRPNFATHVPSRATDAAWGASSDSGPGVPVNSLPSWKAGDPHAHLASYPWTSPLTRQLHLDIATYPWTGQQQQRMSRPVEHCEGCPPLAGARNLGLDDPRAVRPDSHCNFGDRSIRACRATAATQRKSRKRAVPAPRHCSAPTSRPGQSR